MVSVYVRLSERPLKLAFPLNVGGISGTEGLRLNLIPAPVGSLIDLMAKFHWFVQGAIPGYVTRDVMILLKKEGKHIWEELDDYRPIILLNIGLKIFARILTNCLQLVTGDLIVTELNCVMKRRSIQNNLHLMMRQIIAGVEDDADAAVIN